MTANSDAVANQPPALSRREGLALWRQIARHLEAEIAGGALSPGDRLPTEAVLSARHGVNRHTVRRALDSLAARGLLRIEQGRGSFVAEDVLDYPLGPRTRFSEVIRAQNREPEGRVLSAQEVRADSATAEALRIPPGQPVLAVERLGLADNRPVVLGRHHFALPRFAALPEALAGHGSVTRALVALGVADYRRAWTRLTARLPTAEEAGLLQQSVNRPVMIAEALSEDMEGRPIDYTMSRYAAGRVQILVGGLGAEPA
ncbi:phosphonate metabolism transcriptional regulator PhnF [Teichococcus oryzae]|uniref:Phosphonate metabolism transcriptional regulator PhnF n=1 Tax=Teichococcus oryzae TaxID=1608942 RepID=A0A5B2TA63_9PROT|nr:phosphonate metabolism transcriptional regulator PhnF [Pseudoroseomonas oryzae]KAA2211466.1 phosphonate metabolism transcriptional regulator PhnF [Pseudoroseomonas oryzae]